MRILKDCVIDLNDSQWWSRVYFVGARFVVLGLATNYRES